MPARLSLAGALVATVLLALVAVSGAQARAAKIVVGQRYARCTDPHPKTYTTCPDVASKENARTLQVQFMVKKKYCSAIGPQSPGVWAFYNGLKIKNGKITGKLDYNNYALDSQGAPDDYGISFRWTGKFVSSKLMHLVLKGKVTKAGSAVSDCAGKSFTETHDLRAVGF